MEYGCHSLSNPVQELFEPQQLEPEGHRLAASFRQERRVNPHPQIAQEQRYGDKHQAQVRVSCTSVNPRLTHLPEARFDAKTFAVALADLRGSPAYTPGSEQEFLLPALSLFAVAVGAVGHTEILTGSLAFESVC